MFQSIILVCAVGLAPADCQESTALDVFRGPVVANVVMCGMQGQAYLAQTSLTGRGEGEYVKIKCVRSQTARKAPQYPAHAGWTE